MSDLTVGEVRSTIVSLGRTYGEEFERAVIQILLLDKEFSVIILGSLSSDMFEHADHSIIFDAAASLSTAQKAIGVIPVLAELAQRIGKTQQKSSQRELLVEALRTARKISTNGSLQLLDAQTVQYVKEQIGEFATKGNVREALIRAADLWHKGDFEAISLELDTAIRTRERTVDLDLGLDFGDPAAKLLRYRDSANSARHAPIGVPLIDASMRGGLQPGTLGLVIGPAKRGKSMFMVQAGVAALRRGLSVAVVTLEIPLSDYALRFDAHLTGIPVNELATHPSNHAGDIARATLGIPGKLRIKQWGSHQARTGDINLWLRALESRQGFKPDVLLIDYADLLRPTRDRNEHRLELHEIIRSLRQLGTDFDASVWTASQTKRSSFTATNIKMDDVAEDIKKVQVADVILGLCQTTQERQIRRLRLVSLGDRISGGDGTVADCEYSTETMTLRQCITQTRVRTMMGSCYGK